MELLYDKFKIIKDNIIEPDDELSLFENFIENFLESNIFNIHPYYLFQLFNKKQININECINNKIDLYLKDLRSNIRILIKKGQYDLYNGLNKLLQSYIIKLDKLCNIFTNISNTEYNKFNTIIIHDPQIICFLHLELDTLDKNKKYEINKFINNVYIIDKDIKKVNYIWLLKLIGSILLKNINDITIDYNIIPVNYMLMIKLIKIIDKYRNILNYYDYIDKEYINYIVSPLILLIYNEFNNLIKVINIKELIHLLNNKGSYLILNSIINKNKELVTHYINTFIFINKDTLNIDQTIDLLELLIISNNLGLLNSYILQTLNNLNILNYIHEIIHKYIYKNNKFILNIINFIMYNINDKDNFIDQYQTLLVKRLLSSQSDIVLENNCIYIIAKFGEKYINKLLKNITDKESSINDMNNFYTLKNINDTDKLCMLTTSYNNWHINYNFGSLTGDIINTYTSTSYFCTLLNNYNKFYNLRYENKRKLIWFPHYGQVDINYEYEPNKFINIILLPIQLLVLELFDHNNEIDICIIKSQSFFDEYSNKYKDDIIKSLIFGKILIKKGNILELSNKNNISSNLIDIFYNNSTFILDEENNRLENLALARNDIISCVVNHIIKKMSLTFDELLNTIKQKLTLFTVTDLMLTQVLDKMISMDYIIFDNNKYYKIFY